MRKKTVQNEPEYGMVASAGATARGTGMEDAPDATGAPGMEGAPDISEIDFSELMDLRVDYAFKLFATKEPHQLACLLNAITEAGYDRFTEWMMVITHHAFKDKDLIRKLCKEKGEVRDAMAAISKLSQDRNARLDYQRRMDQLYFYNKAMAEKDAIIADQAAELADKDAIIANLMAQLDKAE